jgi:hypothetical protein
MPKMSPKAPSAKEGGFPKTLQTLPRTAVRQLSWVRVPALLCVRASAEPEEIRARVCARRCARRSGVRSARAGSAVCGTVCELPCAAARERSMCGACGYGVRSRDRKRAAYGTGAGVDHVSGGDWRSAGPVRAMQGGRQGFPVPMRVPKLLSTAEPKRK